MQKKLLAIAAIVATLFASAAYAQNGNGSQSVSGGIAVAGEATANTGGVQASSSSNLTGGATAISTVEGVGNSNESVTSIGSGTMAAGGTVTPTGVTTVTSQVSTGQVVASGNTSGNTPALDSTGLLENGATGLTQVSVTGSANGQFNETAVGGSLGISGIAGITTTDTH